MYIYMRNEQDPCNRQNLNCLFRVSPSSICIQRCWDQFPIQDVYGRDFQTLAAGFGDSQGRNEKFKTYHESLILSPLLTGSQAYGNHQLSNSDKFSRAKVLSNQMKTPESLASTSMPSGNSTGPWPAKSCSSTHQHQTKQTLQGRLV